MATLSRPKDLSESTQLHVDNDIASGIPKPFPTSAEREQEELLDSLASVELRLEEEEDGAHVPESSRMDEHRPAPLVTEDLVPSGIGQVQSTCLIALQDLLVVSHRPLRTPDRRHSMPAPLQSRSHLQALVNDLRAQVTGGEMSEGTSSLSSSELLSELRNRVDRLAAELSPHDAELARTLVSLLINFNRLGPSRPIEPASPRALSWGTAITDPYSTLRRHVSDFRLERSNSASLDGGITPPTAVQAVESALAWSEIDAQLETVLSLCRVHTHEDPFADNLPPEYDAADYMFDNLPQYDTLDGKADSASIKTSYKSGASLNGSSSRLQESNNEKMRLDLEAVTLAIDRLYSVTPQLHNQRVELNKTKLQELERAKLKGKQHATNEDLESRELDRMVELIGRASDRKLKDQSVFIDDGLRRKMEVARQKDREKRAAFVEQLANHSEAGRMHSQDASFQQLPARSQSQPNMAEGVLNPHALLSLPEFIREGVPDSVQQRMQQRRDPATLLSLPEFIREHPIPNEPSQSQSSRRQSISQTGSGSHDHNEIGVATTLSRRVSMGNRARSMSEPLAWLLSPRSSSPATSSGLSLGRRSSRKSARPVSAHGTPPEFEVEHLDVSYVAEHHENLQHVLVFLTVSRLKAGHNLEAEVVPAHDHKSSRLILRCHTSSSVPLDLPAQVTPGPAIVTVVGGQHYQIKLPVQSTTQAPDAPHTSDPQLPELLDATHLQSIKPTTFICSSCSLPLIRASQLDKYRDLPSEHWAELVDAWMCHSDQKLHEHVQKGSRDGFWPAEREALVGGSYVLVLENAIVKDNFCDIQPQFGSKSDDWHRVRCICGAIVGRCQRPRDSADPGMVYRLAKYAFRPVSPTAEPTRTPLSAFIVEDMHEYVHAHATYRFVFLDEEAERPRILVWLFKPNMHLAYMTPAQYVIPKSGSLHVAKVLFKVLGPSTSNADLQTILNKYPGFPQAEHLYYPMEVCRRLAALLRESNTAYPESLRTMTGLEVGWLQRA